MKFNLKDIKILFDILNSDSESLKAKALELYKNDITPFMSKALEAIPHAEGETPVQVIFYVGDELVISYATVKTDENGNDILEQKAIKFNGEFKKNITGSEMIQSSMNSIDKLKIHKQLKALNNGLDNK